MINTIAVSVPALWSQQAACAQHHRSGAAGCLSSSPFSSLNCLLESSSPFEKRVCLCEPMQGFWLVGVLLGWALAFRVGLGIRGLWIGIASGDSTAGAVRWACQQAPVLALCLYVRSCPLISEIFSPFPIPQRYCTASRSRLSTGTRRRSAPLRGWRACRSRRRLLMQPRRVAGPRRMIPRMGGGSRVMMTMKTECCWRCGPLPPRACCIPSMRRQRDSTVIRSHSQQIPLG